MSRRTGTMRSVFSTLAVIGLTWAGAGFHDPASAQSGSLTIAPEPATCPASLPAGTTCSSGRSADGAWY